VLRNPLSFPAKPAISPEAQDLMTQLLIKDPAQRLGTKAGAEEIKKHPWFEGINWALLRHQQPPYVPRRAAAAAGAAGSGSASADGVPGAAGGAGNIGANNFENY
jgi:serine/threonine protein kinase